MSYGRSRTGWSVAAFVGVFVLVALTQRILGERAESDVFKLGDNRVELAAGKYELWWQTVIRPEDMPDPEDFRFELIADDGTIFSVRQPFFSAGLPGESDQQMRWRVAVFTLPEDMTGTLTATTTAPVPTGELVLIAE